VQPNPYAEGPVDRKEHLDRHHAQKLNRAQTRQFWGRSYGRHITDREEREIIDNIVAFAEIITEWTSRTKGEMKAPRTRVTRDDVAA